MNNINDWKKYLISKSISINSDRDFAKAMIKIDNIISSYVPSTKGMIWCNGKINPRANISDVDSALNLLSKFGQADLDALGDPSDPNRLSGTPLNSMFISQDESKSDEWTPGNNQNQGVSGSTIPKNNNSFDNKSTKKPQGSNTNDRMKRLTDLIEKIKK